jgi:hypothetical protein
VLRPALAAGSVLASACALTTSLDDLNAGGQPAVGSGAREAATGGAASSSSAGGSGAAGGPGAGGVGGAGGDAGAGGAAPANLLQNGGFEAAPQVDYPCGAPWTYYEASLAQDTIAHSGTYACRVCRTPTGSSYTIDFGTLPTVTTPRGATIHARAWVRALPGATETQSTAITLRIFDSTTLAQLDESPYGAPVQLTERWAAVDVEYMTKAAGLLNVYVFTELGVMGSCFIVDDVAAWAVP